MASKLLLAAGLALAAPLAHGLENGLGRIPQMGYNSWYDWMSNMDEAQLRDTVDAMVEHGLVDLGYNYFNLDDCWSKGRHPNGSQFADPKHFPSSTLKPLADYAHGKGMLFGTYTDRGSETCAGRPGAQDHESIDAQTYADWGVDYLKEDSCHAVNDPAAGYRQYGLMRDALNKTGRPIFFSLCGWEKWYSPPNPALNYSGGGSLGNSWRIGPDDTTWHGVLTNIDINADLAANAGPGGWNDPCLLLAETWQGKQRMTEAQTRAQFNMWAVMASPLLISANVRNMSAMNMATYKNKEVIAVNQDALGKQGQRLVGGPLAGKGGGGGSANIHVTLAACDASDAHQQWAEGPSSSKAPCPAGLQTYLNKGTGRCLNSDDCGSDLIVYPFVTSGCHKNHGFCFKVADGVFKSDMPQNVKGSCVQVSGGQLSMTGCVAGAPSQNFTLAPDSTIRAGNGQCVTTAGSAPSGSASTNVWARPLSTGGWAAVFVNVGSAPADVVCDAACFTAMGVPAGATLSAKDLWTGAASSVATAQGYTAKALAGAGGSSMLTFHSA